MCSIYGDVGAGAGARLHGRSDGELLDRVAALVAARNRLDAELTAAVRVAEARQACERDGLRSMASWLCGHARLSRRAAHRLVATGRALAQLPAVEAAFACGAVSGEQVAVIAPVAAADRRAEAGQAGVRLAAVDTTLAEVARTQPCEQLGAVVAHYLQRLDPDGPEPDPTAERALPCRCCAPASPRSPC